MIKQITKLLKPSLYLLTSNPSMEYTRYKLLDKKSVLFEDDENVTDPYLVGGIKLVYRLYAEVPRFIRVFGIRIKITPEIKSIETAIFWRPLKKYWPSELNSPYEIIGKKSSPFLHCWLQIKRDFNNVNEEIRQIRIESTITSKNIRTNLHNQSKQFIEY